MKQLVFILLGVCVFVVLCVSVSLYVDGVKHKRMYEEQLQENEELKDSLEVLASVVDSVESNYIAFRTAVGHSESRGNPFVTRNPIAMGKYQFTLPALRAMDSDILFHQFHENPETVVEAVQDSLFDEWMSLLHSRLYVEIEQYEGKEVGGIVVTRSGVLAMAHLGGVQGAKNYLHSDGRYNPSDGWTQLSDYLGKFSTYNF